MILDEAHTSQSMLASSQKSRPRRCFPSKYFGILLFCSLAQVLSGYWSFVRSQLHNCQTEEEAGTVPYLKAQLVPMHNTSSYVRTDILKIVHMPEDSSIEVHLRSPTTRRCRNPVFKGRISGWSLSVIDFEYNKDHKHKSDVVVGKYDIFQMPVSGRYFVEILVVLCEDYSKDFLGVHLKNQCLEDMTMGNHRITEGSEAASIEIIVDRFRSQTQNSSSRGRWLHRDFLATQRQRRQVRNSKLGKNITNTDDDKKKETQFPKPLFTRYQPKECVISERNFKESKNTKFCQQFVDRTRFDSYTFRWHKGRDEILNKDILQIPTKYAKKNVSEKIDGRLESGQNIHVCFLGASHSRVLNNKCQSLLKRTHKRANEKGSPPLDILNVNCSFAEVLFPKNLTEDWVISDVVDRGCTHAVVGLFQWPFSYAQNQPDWSFSKWKTEMSNVTSILYDAARNVNFPLQQILLRSAHPNGFKWQISRCPPGDIRSPPNAKLASGILREIAESYSDADDNEDPIVNFLGTGFVTDPVWDSPEDWSHYNLEEGSVEAKFILSEILGHQ